MHNDGASANPGHGDRVNKRMNRYTLLFLGLLAGSAGGQGPPDMPLPEGDQASPSQGPEAGTENTEQEPRDAPAPLHRFVPSEKIRADDAVAFPVDI